jgi:hypothetical protein
MIVVLFMHIVSEYFNTGDQDVTGCAAITKSPGRSSKPLQ